LREVEVKGHALSSLGGLNRLSMDLNATDASQRTHVDLQLLPQPKLASDQAPSDHAALTCEAKAAIYGKAERQM